MSEAFLDELCPPYIGDERIVLALDPSSPSPRAFTSVLITVDYTKTAPEGVMLPLRLVIQGTDPASYQERVFHRVRPASLVFTPREGGPHLVMLREVAHNRWWGRLKFHVDGELLEPPRPI